MRSATETTTTVADQWGRQVSDPCPHDMVGEQQPFHCGTSSATEYVHKPPTTKKAPDNATTATEKMAEKIYKTDVEAWNRQWSDGSQDPFHCPSTMGRKQTEESATSGGRK